MIHNLSVHLALLLFYSCHIRLAISQITTTIAGSIVAGVSGSRDGQGAAASFVQPIGITVDINGTVYIVEQQFLRRMNSSGYVTRLYRRNTSTNRFFFSDIASSGTEAVDLIQPQDVTITRNGLIYISSAGQRRILRFNGTDLSVFAGSGLEGDVNGVGTSARFRFPNGIASDSKNILYVADTNSSVIKSINSTGFVSSYISIPQPVEIAVDQFDNLIVSSVNTTLNRGYLYNVSIDAQTRRPRADLITSFDDIQLLDSPSGIAIDSRQNIYISDSDTHKIYKLSRGKSRMLVVGGNGESGFADGEGTTAIFASPMRVAIDTNDYVWIADSRNGQVRRLVSCHDGFEWSYNLQRCLISCEPGQYGPQCKTCPNNAVCSIDGFKCMAGYEKSTDMQSCALCGPGTVKQLVSNEQCTKCGIDMEPIANRTLCVPCKSGMYKSDYLDNCIPCPYGSTCQSGQTLCSAGFEPNPVNETCQPCKIGFSKPAVGNTPCLSCPEDRNNSMNPQKCVCNPGTFELNSICTKCPNGAECSDGDIRCMPGYSNSINRFTCDFCAVGFAKSNYGPGSCQECTNGLESNDQRTECVCKSDRYKKDTLCLPCPDGAKCENYQFSCLAGYGIKPSRDGCEFCNNGFYKVSVGNTPCIRCNRSMGFESCLAKEFTCDIGYQPNTAFDSCIACPEGKYKDFADNSQCLECPVNAICSKSGYQCKAGFRENAVTKQCVSRNSPPPSPPPPALALASTTISAPVTKDETEQNQGTPLGLSLYVIIGGAVGVGGIFFLVKMLRSRKSSTLAGVKVPQAVAQTVTSKAVLDIDAMLDFTLSQKSDIENSTEIMATDNIMSQREFQPRTSNLFPRDSAGDFNLMTRSAGSSRNNLISMRSPSMNYGNRKSADKYGSSNYGSQSSKSSKTGNTAMSNPSYKRNSDNNY